jgi:hypothetical protein
LAPIIADAYGFTDRERAVTKLVGSRGELVARLFFDHYAPRLTTTNLTP